MLHSCKHIFVKYARCTLHDVHQTLYLFTLEFSAKDHENKWEVDEHRKNEEEECKPRDRLDARSLAGAVDFEPFHNEGPVDSEINECQPNLQG